MNIVKVCMYVLRYTKASLCMDRCTPEEINTPQLSCAVEQSVRKLVMYGVQNGGEWRFFSRLELDVRLAVSDSD